MREDLISFLETLNNDLNGSLLNINIPKYVDKIQEYATIICICKQGKINAFIAFYENDENGEIAFLTMIAVGKSSRGLGFGKKLMEISIKEIKEKGFKLYKLQVKKDNLKAIELYKELGFRKVSLEDGLINMEMKLQ